MPLFGIARFASELNPNHALANYIFPLIASHLASPIPP
jgi:hypothetical protein